MRIFTVRLKGTVIAAALVIAAAAAASTAAVGVFKSGNRELPVYSVERDDNKLAVTFDCAWNADDIDDILDTLDKYNAKATFFVCGAWAEKYGGAVKSIYERGHEIGNHSYNHADYTALSYNQILTDIARADAAVSQITGENPTVVRAPAGGYNDDVIRAVEETGRMCVQWSVDSIDYGKKGGDADGIRSRVLDKVGAGDIILFHNGTLHTAEVLPEILARLSNSYSFCTVSELMYTDGFYLDNAGRMIRLQ